MLGIISAQVKMGQRVLVVLLLVNCFAAGFARSHKGQHSHDHSCHTGHEFVKFGEVFQDEHCHLVRCVIVGNKPTAIEHERCPEPTTPPGAKCTISEETKEAFPRCCPTATCDSAH